MIIGIELINPKKTKMMIKYKIFQNCYVVLNPTLNLLLCSKSLKIMKECVPGVEGSILNEHDAMVGLRSS